MLYHYYVDGECEQKLINTFKRGVDQIFRSGKVEIFNVCNEIISRMRIISFSKGTTLVLVYDTDVKANKIFEDNISKLTNVQNIDRIVHLQSIENFEGEIVYCSSIKNINEVFNSEGKAEFKRNFLNCNLKSKLKKIRFNFELLWSRKSKDNGFAKYSINEEFRNLVFINKKK